MTYEVTGICVQVGVLEIYGNYSKQMLALEIDGGNGYKNYAIFECSGKLLHWMARNKVGDTLTVKFSLSGNQRERDGAIFNCLRAFYIAGGSGGQLDPPPLQPPRVQETQGTGGAPQHPTSYEDESEDSVPF
jgi:hypothetical protein